MLQADLIIWLEAFALVVTILLYVFEKESKRKRIILGVALLVVLVIIISFAWLPTPYPGWVICWHGYLDQDEEQGYEFLAAYPEPVVRQGLNLSTPITNPWNGKTGNYANDSLKACYYKGEWYGSSNLDWYPHVSYLRLERNSFVACHDSPHCGGQRWSLTPNGTPPDYIVGMLREPNERSIHILNYISTP